ncbi:MAG TPA: hypothetical protein VF622_03210 [Segetibacter sp.]|jgi:hypothetical protein
MAQQKVELRKIRDFSENLNDTFVFIKQNFKPLIISFLGIAGIFMLAAAIIQGIYQNEMGEILEQIIGGRVDSDESITTPVSLFGSNALLIYSFAWINMVAMKVAIISYVKIYDRHEGEAPKMLEVWGEFKKYYLKVVVFSTLILLLIIIGCFFCFVPGAYFWVVFVPFEMILMIENKSFSEAFSRCYVIIKDNFWQSFGIYIIAFLIYFVMSNVIGGIIGLITGVISYFTTGDISSTVVWVTSVFNIFSFVFYIVYFISAVLNYYSLTEKYDGTGILRRLDNLGGSSNNFNNIEEQY